MLRQPERNLEPLADHHAPLLAAVALEGVDTSPVVGGANRYVGYGQTKYGYGPACLLDIVQTPYVAEPHVTWFPWVTASQRMAHFKWAMELLAKDREVLLNIEKKYKDFFDHFAKKGFLRKIGYIENLPIVEEVHMYQVKRSVVNE